MHRMSGFVKWTLALSSLIFFTSMSIAADRAPRDPTTMEKDTEKEGSNSWSSAALWDSLFQSKSSASFSSKINDKLPELKFTINGSFNGKFKGKYFYPSYVEIRDTANGKIVQNLRAKGNFDNHGDGFSEIDFFLAEFIQLIDLNGDGYLDLRILFNTGATGNNWYATYIYDPRTKRFKYHDELSLLSGIAFDPASGIIKTYWRGGWCAECSEDFRLDKNDRLILKKLEWTEIDRIDSKTGCFMYTGVPRNKYAVNLGYAFHNMDYSRFEKYISKRVKILSKEELAGSLDGRRRGPLGTPY